MRSQVKTGRDYQSGDLQVLKNTVKFVAATGDVFEFSKEELDEALLALLPDAGKWLKDVTVTLNETATVLYGFKPNNGQFFGQFAGFTHKPDQLPEPKFVPGGETKQRRDGKGSWVTKDKWTYTALYTLLTEGWEGVQVIQNLDYIFVRDPSNRKLAYLEGSKQQIERNMDFFAKNGVDLGDVDINYATNVLPEVEELLLDANKPVQIFMKDGWIDRIEDVPVGFKVGKKAAPKKPAQTKGKPAVAPEKRSPQAQARANKPVSKKSNDEIVEELTGDKPKGKAPAKKEPAPAKAPVKEPAKKAPARSKAKTEDDIPF